MKGSRYAHRSRQPRRHVAEEIESARRGPVREYGPFVIGGVLLIAAFAFAGHIMGRNASAHNAGLDDADGAVVSPSTALISKGSLLPGSANFEIVNLRALQKQAVIGDGKGDLLASQQASAEDVTIEPVAVSLKAQEPAEPAVKRLSLTPSPAKIEKAFRLKRDEKQKVIAQRRIRLAEENCLARAVYFEARSESELGQLAVAKVVLNRVKDSNYPNSICGVVYQGSGSRNSCQFSFACDGLPDDVKQPRAWAQSKKIAQKALAGDASIQVIGAANHYHADYVNPKWAKSMKRLIKIGRHVFYTDG